MLDPRRTLGAVLVFGLCGLFGRVAGVGAGNEPAVVAEGGGHDHAHEAQPHHGHEHHSRLAAHRPHSPTHSLAESGERESSARPTGLRKAVDPEYAQACERSETCADGRACIDGACAHCIADHECEGDLLCARDRCVAPDDVACTRDEDCGAGSYCVDDLRAHGPARRRHFTVCTADVEGDADSRVVLAERR